MESTDHAHQQGGARGVAVVPHSPPARSGHRLKILPKVESRGHRYVYLRYLTQLITVGILFAVPLSGLARVDLFAGKHRLLFRDANWREGLAGVIVGIAMLYVVTFLINLAFGRMFCGWGCPVGFLNRLADVSELKPRKETPKWKQLRDRIGPYAHAFVLVFPCVLWWTSASAFLAFSDEAAAWAWAVTIVGTAAVYALGRWARWKFCMTTCPIGLYYSFVAPGEHFGIHFREATKDGLKDACLHCNACINVCPVDLNPMDLSTPASPRGGIAVPDAPGNNHCLKCGDCIQACEMMIDSTATRRGITDVPLLFGFYNGSQRVTREKERGDDDSVEPTSERASPRVDASPADLGHTDGVEGHSARQGAGAQPKAESVSPRAGSYTPSSERAPARQ